MIWDVRFRIALFRNSDFRFRILIFDFGIDKFNVLSRQLKIFGEKLVHQYFLK